MNKSLIFLVVVCLLMAPQNLFAGGPFIVNSDGVASTWDSSSAIALHPEGGECATFSNAEMDDKIETNVSEWSDITGITLSFAIVDGIISENVDGDNYTDYYVDSSDDAGLIDSINPVIFDDDASIVADLFGSANKFVVLGFAGPDGFSSDFSEIVDAQAFFNCRCLAGNDEGACPGGIVFTEDDLDFTMTHEIGHMLGFDHTQVNQPLAEETDCYLDSLGDCDDIPTMYPQSVDAGDQISPHRDDEVIALTLYGSSTWDSALCTVTGSLVDENGDPLRCADIQAETNDPADTIAIVSGAFAPAEDNDGDGYTQDDGECLSDCGDFELRGLSPSKTYTITVKPIDSQWNGGSSLSPCGVEQLTGIIEEEITTISSCDGGDTQALGTVETLSSGGVEEGGDGDDADDDDDASSEAAAISCALSSGDHDGTSADKGLASLWVFLFTALSFGLYRYYYVRNGIT